MKPADDLRPRWAACSAFCVYVLAVFFLGALLAYPLFVVLTAFGVDAEFYKVVGRSQKLLAIALLIPLLLYLRRHCRQGWGLPASRSIWLTEVAKGWCVGAVMLSVVVICLFGLGVRVYYNPEGLDVIDFIRLALKSLLAGLLIAHIEELWFRGGLFTASRAFLGTLATVGVTAAIYAAVHFIRPEAGLDPAQVNWLSGFVVTEASFVRFSDPQIWDSFVALWVAGVLLALVRLRTHSIGLCIGIHAGWVAIIKFSRGLSRIEWNNDWVFLIGRYDGVIGELAAVIVGLSALAYYLLRIKPFYRR